MQLLKYARIDTIQKANDVMSTGKPTSCPCCSQVAKVYKRHLHRSACLTLIDIYKRSGWYVGEDGVIGWYVHVTDLKIISQDFHIAKHWRLIEQAPKDAENKTKKTSGYWRITQNGQEFVENKLKIQEWVHTYNKQVLGFTGELVSIKDCLGEGFDYQELMKG